jgi:hypothetical protein
MSVGSWNRCKLFNPLLFFLVLSLLQISGYARTRTRALLNQEQSSKGVLPLAVPCSPLGGRAAPDKQKDGQSP